MDRNEFLTQHFRTLREEIKAIKARSFWIVAMGLFGIPVIMFMAQDSSKFVSIPVPYLVLVIIIMFLAEQNALMRAGRFIRLRIEPHVEDTIGWEEWLESRGDLRLMDRHFFACFILVFFLYYFMAIGNALQTLYSGPVADDRDKLWLYGAVVTYGIGRGVGLVHAYPPLALLYRNDRSR
jgi:hypothetical protein